MPSLIVKVRCPFCSHSQNSTTLKTVKCQRCGRSFEVYLLDSKGKIRGTRIISLIKGSLSLLYREAYIQKLRRGRI